MKNWRVEGSEEQNGFRFRSSNMRILQRSSLMVEENKNLKVMMMDS